MKFSQQKQKFLRYGLTAATLALGTACGIPEPFSPVAGQTTTTQTDLIPTIEVGLSAYPITFDGHVTSEEYDNDTNDYPYESFDAKNP